MKKLNLKAMENVHGGGARGGFFWCMWYAKMMCSKYALSTGAVMHVYLSCLFGGDQ